VQGNEVLQEGGVNSARNTQATAYLVKWHSQIRTDADSANVTRAGIAACVSSDHRLHWETAGGHRIMAGTPPPPTEVIAAMDVRDMMARLIDDLRSSNPQIPEDTFDVIAERVLEKADNEPPPVVALIGESGVGKSSTLNALFNAGQETSHYKACTVKECAVEVSAQPVEGARGILQVYDMPGLGESMATRERNLEAYERVLAKADVALWILDANFRAIESVQLALTGELRSINHALVDRMVFALNKVDLVHPGETAWHPLANIPSEEQEQNIQGRIADVEAKIIEAVPKWHGAIIGYSATKRYNLPQLFYEMLAAVPERRGWVLASRKALADFLELVNPAFLPPDIQTAPQGGQSSPETDPVWAALQEMTDAEFQKYSSKKQDLLAWILARRTPK
jgi:predicted GTPase